MPDLVSLQAGKLLPNGKASQERARLSAAQMPILYPAQWAALGRWKNISWRTTADQGGGGPWVRD